MHNQPAPSLGGLLSRTEECSLLEAPLLRRLPHRSSLFEPTVRFYDEISDEKTIHEAIREIHRWLGAKPVRIAIEYSMDTSFEYSDHRFTIPRQLLSQPYQLAALLALAITRQILTTRLNEDVSDSLVETASIQAGLGAVILNGITKEPRFTERWFAHRTEHHAHLLALTAYTHSSYAEAVAAFCHESKIHGRTLLAQLTPASIALLPRYYQQPVRKARHDPAVVRQQHRHARHHVYKIVAASFATGLVVVLALFVYAQRPYAPSQAVRDQYEKTQLLSSMYHQCILVAQKQQNAYGQDDIFVERNINANISRCQSIRNTYNYEVGIYNQLIERN